MQKDEDEQSESDAWIGMIVWPIRRNGNVLWQRAGLAVWPCIPMLDSSLVTWHRMKALPDSLRWERAHLLPAKARTRHRHERNDKRLLAQLFP